MVQQDLRNTIAGWDFGPNQLADALQQGKMLNPSIDLSNPCNLNCPYCFIEEKNSSRKLRKPHELTLAETLQVIDDIRAAGAETVNIVGAGEPTIDPHFRDVVEHVHEHGLTTVLFTNGIALASNPDLVDFLYLRKVSIVVKLNSFRPEIQDLAAGRPGYTSKRDHAIELLIDRSFTAHLPTRLGIDTIVFRGNLDELPEIHDWARKHNVFPIAADYIPTGRTEDGLFQGFAALEHLQHDAQRRAAQLLAPISDQQRSDLTAQLAHIDERHGILRGPVHAHAYYGGGICSQILGVYVDIEGNIWPCVARKTRHNGNVLTSPLGNVRGGDLPSAIWQKHQYMRRIREDFDGGCPYKPFLSGRDQTVLTKINDHQVT